MPLQRLFDSYLIFIAGDGREGEYGCGGGEKGGISDRRQPTWTDGVSTPTGPLLAPHPQLVAHQLLPLAKFTGETRRDCDGVTGTIRQLPLLATEISLPNWSTLLSVSKGRRLLSTTLAIHGNRTTTQPSWKS